jgi:hypothetical protein
MPLDGATRLELRVDFGGGDLTIGPAANGMLIAGDAPDAIVERLGPGRVRIHPAVPSHGWRPYRWQIGVTDVVPVELMLATGADRADIDLSRLLVRRLRLDTGASETRVRLPMSGPTSVHVACGLALVTLEVPMDRAVRIRGSIVLGSSEIDERRFARTADGWASADAADADDLIDITLEAALGTVRVV